MRDDFGVCEEKIQHSCVVLEENGMRIIFENREKREVRKIKVDGCVFPVGKAPKRCDWLIITKDAVEYYVELKGCRITDAIEQIEQTFVELKPDINKIRYSFVVGSRVPKLGTKIQKYKIYFWEKYRSKLEVRTLQHRCVI